VSATASLTGACEHFSGSYFHVDARMKFEIRKMDGIRSVTAHRVLAFILEPAVARRISGLAISDN
jgi:hypothetical protein